MTQQEIIELARQAGVEDSNEYDHLVCTEVELVAFAKLIAEKEREACIAHAMTSAEKAIDVAIKLEREACAKVCYELPWKDMTQIPSNLAFAAAIRARGQA